MKTRISASKQVLAAIATGVVVFGAIPAALARTIDFGTIFGFTHSIETDLSTDAYGDDVSVDVDGSVETDSEIDIETESDGGDSHQSTDVDSSTQAGVQTNFDTDDDASVETDAHLQSDTSAHLSVTHEEEDEDEDEDEGENSDDEDELEHHETSVESHSHTHIHLDASADAEEALEQVDVILENLDIDDFLDVDELLQGGAAAEAEIEAFIERLDVRHL